jgi:hypothetical protein
MADETQTGPGMMQGFFKDPRNLATALVFLAAAAQPKQDGQSGVAHGLQSAVGALGFRGGLDRGLRQQRIQDEGIQQQRLRDSQAQENEKARTLIAQQGLGLQGAQLNQNERLAQENRAHQERLAQTARPNTPEEAQLIRAQAGYYNRMPAAGSGDGSSESKMRTKMFEDLFATQWKSEVDQAALEGRPPDVTKILPQMSNFAAGLSMVPMGLRMERGADGQLSIVIPGGADGAPPAGAPAAAVPGSGMSPVEPAGVDFSAPPVDPKQFKPIRPRGSSAPSSEFITEQQLGTMDGERLRTFLRDPRLSKDQAVKIRQELAKRTSQRASRYDMGY